MFQTKQNKRIKSVLYISILLFFLIILKVFYIQVIEYNKLNKLATDLWNRNLIVKADRGKILDRNGKVIVDNTTTYGLYLIPSQIIDKEKTAKQLSEILNTTYEEMYKHVTKRTSLERVHPEGRNLTTEIKDKINNLKLDGVYLLKESKRN